MNLAVLSTSPQIEAAPKSVESASSHLLEASRRGIENLKQFYNLETISLTTFQEGGAGEALAPRVDLAIQSGGLDSDEAIGFPYGMGLAFFQQSTVWDEQNSLDASHGSGEEGTFNTTSRGAFVLDEMEDLPYGMDLVFFQQLTVGGSQNSLGATL